MSGAGGGVLAVCGVDREAAIVAPFVGGRVLMSGGDMERLRAGLERWGASGEVRAVISFGLAGGLDPALRASDLICPDAVRDGAADLPTDAAWSAALRARTRARRVARVAGVDRLASTCVRKAELFAHTGAATVDMESHAVARWAAALGLPFAGLRAVSDDARHALPSSAAAGMGPDGRVRTGAVLAGLARRPWQLPALIRTAQDVGAGLRTLARAAETAGGELAWVQPAI